MEKNVVLAIALSIGLFVLYVTFFGPSSQPAASPTKPSAATTPLEATPPPAGRKPIEGAESAAEKLESPESWEHGIELTVTSKGALERADVWGCRNHDRRKIKKGEEEPVSGDPAGTTDSVAGLPGALSVDLVTKSSEVPDLLASAWKLVRTDGSVAREIDAAGLRLTTPITPSVDEAHPYDASVVVVIRNVDAPATTKTATFEIVGPSPAPPPKGSKPTADDGVLIATSGESGEVEFLPAAKIHSALAENPGIERTTQGKWAYVAARSNFFLGALVPITELPPGTTVGFRAATRPDEAGKPVPTAAAVFRVPFEIPAKGAEVRFEFMYYAGPNWRALLHDESSPYHVLDGATRQTGFLGLKLTWITQLLAWLLRMLMPIVGNAGLAVITLTILVRGAMFPLSRKSQISMRLHGQKMQRIKPKMDAIKAKYKDPKKQQEATMKLMREEKVSILPGGCLLAFLQMPIWIALYNVLQTTFEMRHASFLWVKDLTEPDHMLRLGFLSGVPLMPEWLNLLPILMMATWYFSAAMQPLPADPQQAQTAKMMRWMPVLMGIFLYSYPAGLALYMTMSAVWSIGETWLIRKVWLAKLEKALT